jgi:hypothetical protein
LAYVLVFCFILSHQGQFHADSTFMLTPSRIHAPFKPHFVFDSWGMKCELKDVIYSLAVGWCPSAAGALCLGFTNSLFPYKSFVSGNLQTGLNVV